MKFGTIIADPPWNYARASGDKKMKGYSSAEYRPLSIDDLCDLPVANLAAEDSVLLLWVSFPHLASALRLTDAWGFEHVSGLTWVKTTLGGQRLTYGVGYWFRGCTELVLVGKRGRAYRTNERGGFMSPPKGHSRKPDNLHEIAEKHFPAPRLEMFGRRNRDGWTVIGNEAPDTFGEDIFKSLKEIGSRANH